MISTRNIVLSAAGFAALAQAVTVNTPASAVQCQPVQLSWSQGTAPFYVSIIPGGQPSAAALENIPTQNGNSYTWMVDLSAGTSITVKVVDSTGDTNYSDQITIQQGTTTDCAASGSSGSSASGAAAGGASSASSAAGGAASSASSAAARVTSSAGAALSSGRNALSSAATGATSAIGAAAAAASSSTPSSGAFSTAQIGMGMSLVAGAAAVFALVA